MGMSNKRAYRVVEATKEEILGDHVSILRTKPGYELTRLFVFSDGLLRIGPDGDLFPLDDLPSKYASGEICNQAAAGSTISLPGLGEFKTLKEFGGVSVHDRIGEIHDMHRKLNGRESVVHVCARAFTEYSDDPTYERKEALRAAYEAVPQHLRRYCGDMDTRDTAIRKALGLQ